MVLATDVASKIANEKDLQFDVVREMNELRNQLSMIKRIGFFFGAGTSMAIGISGIYNLTDNVKSKLSPDEQQTIKIIEESIQVNQPKEIKITIEDILNQVRLIRQITKDSKSQQFCTVCGEQARLLDINICRKIYEIISEEEKKSDFAFTKKLVSWINWLNREYTKEIFTTNYDLVLEKSFESLQIPYYDGFVGANEPFFLPESIETSNRLDYPPLAWIRLWKIHGSLGWFWKNNPNGRGSKVVRLGVLAKECETENNELVIYPSKEKYELSRKQPFIAYFDRLKHYLNEGEGLFIICGYSFSDEHINEIFFNALQQNNRLHIISFSYSDDDLVKVRESGKPFLNFTAYGPTTANIIGNSGKWNIESPKPTEVDDKGTSFFWDFDNKRFKLGDFKNLVDFFLEISGKQESIIKSTGG